MVNKKITKKYSWKDKPLSWSAISSFMYDPEQWYSKYVLDQKQNETNEMLFGKTIGKKLETDAKYLPMIPRHSKMEHQFKCKFGNIELIGYADTFCDKTFKKLSEFKTGKRAWDQKRVDSHGQIDMYLLMNWIMNKVQPQDVEITLVWMPTQDNGDFSISFIEPIEKNIKIFKTTRRMADVLRFGVMIKNIYKQMELYERRHVK